MIRHRSSATIDTHSARAARSAHATSARVPFEILTAAVSTDAVKSSTRSRSLRNGEFMR